MNCPLCDSKNTECYTDFIEHIRSEDFLECKDCGYMYSYAYGSTQETIGDKVFYWGYQSTPENKKAQDAARACFLETRKKI